MNTHQKDDWGGAADGMYHPIMPSESSGAQGTRGKGGCSWPILSAGRGCSIAAGSGGGVPSSNRKVPAGTYATDEFCPCRALLAPPEQSSGGGGQESTANPPAKFFSNEFPLCSNHNSTKGWVGF